MSQLLNLTIGDLLKEKVSAFGDQEAVVYHDEGVRYTYEQFDKITDDVAKALVALGVQKGEHIAIWATNVPEWLLLQFGSAKIGAVLVTVNTNYQAAELEYLLKQSDTTTLFLIDHFRSTSYVDTVYRITEKNAGQLYSDQLPHLKNFIYIGQDTPDEMMNWDQFMTLSRIISDDELNERKASLSPDDVINMQYTSGTTGFPKGVMLTHNNIVNNGHQIAQCMKLTEKDRLCIPVPFFHCFGCVLGTMAAVSVGATIVALVEFDPERVLNVVEKERCTGLHGVPTMFIAELNHENFKNYDLTTLRTGIMAGSPCPIEVMKKVIHDMGADEITICYGQTESSPVITQTKADDPIERRVETVGRPHPNVEVKIIDPLTGEEVGPNVQGELCTRGYHVMKGYYNMPDATNDVIDEENWLHTGDLAVIDEEGYVKITGRLKDMIIRGGENVYPREIEEFLYRHPDILDVQVVGVPDQKYGEKVAACIQLKEGSQLTEEEIKVFCQGQISRYKIPEYIFFVDAYPMTASGKIQKYKLREQAQEWINLKV